MNTKAVLGLLVLAASAALIFALSGLNTQVPYILGGVGALGMAAGSLLVGTSEGGRPV